MANRTRNKAVTLRMTEEEFAFFQKQMEKAKQKNQTDFLLAVLRKKPITVIDELRPVLTELKKQGTNLNQALRYTHESGGEKITILERAVKGCHLCYQNLYKTWEQIDIKTKKK